MEHVEELNKPVLYLVSDQSPLHSRCSMAYSCLLFRIDLSTRDAARQSFSPALADGISATLPPVAHSRTPASRVIRQVFEYLSTDLKKYMDRNGKGPSNPMHPDVIKVWSPRKPCSHRCCTRHAMLLYACLWCMRTAMLFIRSQCTHLCTN